MPKRTDLRSILLLGSGPIVIGQGAEFDYSGTQAVRALKEEGYRVILVNSNPATIMTDPELADRTYIEPVTPEWVARVIERERPDALLPTMGGQTALNVAMALTKDGTLAKYGVELIGANERAIRVAEDREEFAKAMQRIGLATPRGRTIRSLEEALRGGGRYRLPRDPAAVVHPRRDGRRHRLQPRGVHRDRLARAGALPVGSVLVEKSIVGWKEFELEVMRDGKDNVVIVCSIENLDPMGVHTGDSITVAPAMTLTDREYQVMRDSAIKIIREVGVEAGGCNIQFAVSPTTGEQLVIEMNPRVSRSSALASKATGFPIARIGAKVAVGYTLDELPNDITKTTPASFEPVLDYVVVKVPRFAFEKFPTADPKLGTQMKAVGEAMAIGRTFKEAFQKGFRALEADRSGWELGRTPLDDRLTDTSLEAIKAAIRTPTAERIFQVKRALQAGRHGGGSRPSVPVSTPGSWTRCSNCVESGTGLGQGRPSRGVRRGQPHAPHEADGVLRPAAGGPAWHEGARSPGPSPRAEDPPRLQDRGHLRRRVSLEDALPLLLLRRGERGPVQGRPDDRDPGQRSQPHRAGGRVRLLLRPGGAGLPGTGLPTVMVNSNPETVSTDYDISDTLYFEPLTLEDVLEIVHVEKPFGVVVQLGGQTPLKLARGLEAAGVPILGTSPDNIDAAEDRKRFEALARELGVTQPPAGTAMSLEEAVAGRGAGRLSRAWSGRRTCWAGGGWRSSTTSRRCGTTSPARSGWRPGHPVLIDRFLEDAFEADVDAIADGTRCVIGGVMQHIEDAGIHSGDSACVLAAVPHHRGAGGADAELHPGRSPSSSGWSGSSTSSTPSRTAWSTCSRSTRGRRAPCPSSPRPPACRSPAWRPR